MSPVESGFVYVVTAGLLYDVTAGLSEKSLKMGRKR